MDGWEWFSVVVTLNLDVGFLTRRRGEFRLSTQVVGALEQQVGVGKDVVYPLLRQPREVGTFALGVEFLEWRPVGMERVDLF